MERVYIDQIGLSHKLSPFQARYQIFVCVTVRMKPFRRVGRRNFISKHLMVTKKWRL
jgi:hypothetical protein